LGEISNKINEMINRILESAEWTSANPTHINTLIQVNAIENPDFESDIKNLVKDSPQGKEFTKMKKGHVGELNRMTSQQFGNIRELATNPAGFIIGTFIRKFAKGVGVIAFALIIFEAVKWIIGELLKPGRFLDLRFKRDINKEIIAFRKREDQQKIKQGFSNIIITTIGGLRPTSGNQITNTLNIVNGRGGQEFPSQFAADPILMQSAGASLSKAVGRRRTGGGRRFG